MLLKDYNLKPFPNINLTTKELDNYIFSKEEKLMLLIKKNLKALIKFFI